LQLNSFFSIVDTFLSCEDIAGQSCTMVRRCRFFGDFLRPAFPASHVPAIKKKLQGKNIMSTSATQGGHNKDDCLSAVRRVRRGTVLLKDEELA